MYKPEIVEKTTAALLVTTLDELARIEKLVSVADLALEALRAETPSEIEDVKTLLVDIIGRLNVLMEPLQSVLNARRKATELKAAA
jgi:hypothetical protein